MSSAETGREPRLPRPVDYAVRLAVPAALALLAASACARLGAGGGGGDALVLGLAIPLTDGAGSPDPYGVTSKMGAELAMEELNAGSALGGRRLALRMVDDQGSDSIAIVVADSLVSDAAVLAVVGHVYSGTTIEAAQRYDGELAAVATSATSPEISRLGDWIFRVASSDSANAVALAGTAGGLGRRIAVLYSNDDYGQGLARNFASALRARGGAVAEMDPFLDGIDFRPYLLRMKERGVDLVFFAGLQDPAARAIAQAQQVGLPARFVGGDGVEGLAGMGARYDGTAVGLLFHPDMSDSSRAFTQRYRARYGRDPDSSAALAYDAVRLLAQALGAGHRDRASIRAYLAGVGRDGRGGSPAFEGVAGTVKFDEHGDPVNKRFTMGVIQGGTITLPEAGR